MYVSFMMCILKDDEEENPKKKLTPMLPFARSRVPMTPSITSLMLRTPSSSRRSAASRTSSASKGSLSRAPDAAGFGVGVLGVTGVLGREGRSLGLMGEENSSEGSTLFSAMFAMMLSWRGVW